MNDNINSFPEEQWGNIGMMNKLKWIMWVFLITFAISEGFMGSNYWLTPLTEWISMLLFVNYFVLLSTINSYYDTVHPFDVSIS